jgi:hypothetical protein
MPPSFRCFKVVSETEWECVEVRDLGNIWFRLRCNPAPDRAQRPERDPVGVLHGLVESVACRGALGSCSSDLSGWNSSVPTLKVSASCSGRLLSTLISLTPLAPIMYTVAHRQGVGKGRV